MKWVKRWWNEGWTCKRNPQCSSHVILGEFLPCHDPKATQKGKGLFGLHVLITREVRACTSGQGWGWGTHAMTLPVSGGRNWSRTMEECSSLAFSLTYSATRSIYPRDTTDSELGSSTIIINEEMSRWLAQRLIQWRHFLNWDSPFPDDISCVKWQKT